jgi:hypothetical protein
MELESEETSHTDTHWGQYVLVKCHYMNLQQNVINVFFQVSWLFTWQVTSWRQRIVGPLSFK